jgi:NADPH-dependent ferric siderophore reductase
MIMDGRKNNGGNKNAGRKPKIDEIKVIEQMDAIAVPAQAWRALWAKVEEGDIQAIKTWLSYRFGMPKQQLDVTSGGEKVTAPITWISPEE